MLRNIFKLVAVVVLMSLATLAVLAAGLVGFAIPEVYAERSREPEDLPLAVFSFIVSSLMATFWLLAASAIWKAPGRLRLIALRVGGVVSVGFGAFIVVMSIGNSPDEWLAWPGAACVVSGAVTLVTARAA